MNYDNYLFRVSSLGHIMAAADFTKEKYKSAFDKQLELFGKMSGLEKEYENIANKESKTAISAFDKMEKSRDAFYLQRKIADALKKDIENVELSEGCKTHLMDVWIANEFGRTSKDIRSKYIEKGIQMEDSGIIAYGIVKGWIPEKSTIRKDDGFIMGEIDYEKRDTIYDNKCSWDIWTFYRNVKYLDNPRGNPYYPNMQGYMRLWNKPKSKVVYTLLDTPEKLIENEKKRIAYDFTGSEQMLEEALAEVEKNLKYSDIPINRRIIEINIDRDDEYIENIPLVVKACRTYLNNIKTIYYDTVDS
jgi:hypothetical protein